MTIASCPKCHEQVSLPTSLRDETRVRCPLCQEEYPFAEVLNQLPPLLIVVDRADAERQPASVGAIAAGSPAADRAELETQGSAIDDDAWNDEAWSDESTDKDDVDDEGLDDIALDTADTADANSAVEEEFVGEEEPEANIDAPSPVTFPPAPAFSFDATPGAPTVVSRPRRRRRQSGPIMTMIQVIGGGGLGLVLAQLILWYMPGNWKNANRDPLGLAAPVAKFAPFLVPEQLKNPPVQVAATTGASAPDSKPAARPKKKSQFELTPPKLDATSEEGNSLERMAPGDVPTSDPNISSEPSLTDSVPSKASDKDSPPPTSDTVTTGNDGSPPTKSAVPDATTEPAATNTPSKEKTNGTAAADASKDPFDIGPDSKVDAPKSDNAKSDVTKSDVTKSDVPDSDVPKNAAPKSETKSDVVKDDAAKPVQLGLREATRVGSEDIARLMEELSAAETAWDENPKTNREETLKLLGDWYSAFGRLGEALIFVDRRDAQVAESVAPAEQKLKEVAAQPDKLKFLGGYAALWLDKPRSHNGAVLVGSIISHQPRGQLFETKLKLTTRPEREFSVISTTKIDEALPTGSRAVVVGTIVPDPREAIAGYEGEETPVLYLGSYAPIAAQ